jgi:hypothetical protein
MLAFEELIKILTDETAASYSRRSAISALARLGDERAVESLISALQDKNQYIRREAAKALGELGSPAAIEPLVKALDDSEDQVQRNVITALGKIGDSRAIEPLREMLESQVFFTRSEAERSIRKIEERLEASASPQEKEAESEPPPPLPEVEAVLETQAASEDVEEEESETPPVSADTGTQEAPPGAKKLSERDKARLKAKIEQGRAERAEKLRRIISEADRGWAPRSSTCPGCRRKRALVRTGRIDMEGSWWNRTVYDEYRCKHCQYSQWRQRTNNSWFGRF